MATKGSKKVSSGKKEVADRLQGAVASLDAIIKAVEESSQTAKKPKKPVGPPILVGAGCQTKIATMPVAKAPAAGVSQALKQVKKELKLAIRDAGRAGGR